MTAQARAHSYSINTAVLSVEKVFLFIHFLRVKVYKKLM